MRLKYNQTSKGKCYYIICVFRLNGAPNPLIAAYGFRWIRRAFPLERRGIMIYFLS